MQGWRQHHGKRADSRLETVGAVPSAELALSWTVPKPELSGIQSSCLVEPFKLGRERLFVCVAMQARLLCGNSAQIEKLISSSTSTPAASIER